MSTAIISKEKHVPRPGDARRLLGLGLSGLTVVVLAADAAGKLLVPDLMIANTPPLGLPADPGFYRLLGAILAIAVALYALPRTALLGAVLLTGYLGVLSQSTFVWVIRCSAPPSSVSTSASWHGAVCGFETRAYALYSPCTADRTSNTKEGDRK